MSADSTLHYLLSLESIRDRCSLLLQYPDHLVHFDVDLSKMPTVTENIIQLIKRDYNNEIDNIPPHSRWRHFDATVEKDGPSIPRVHVWLDIWTKQGVSLQDQCKRLLDLFLVSVLLDAGAGATWRYKCRVTDDFYIKYKESVLGKPEMLVNVNVNDLIETAQTPREEIEESNSDEFNPSNEPTFVQPYYNRSEGLALASLDMFLAGKFSSDPESDPFRVDAVALKNLTVEDIKAAFDVNDANELYGLEGRLSLLVRLSSVLETHQEYFSVQSKDSIPSRPGNMLHYLLSHSTGGSNLNNRQVSIDHLWNVIMGGIAGVWPETRTKYNGKSLGDVWPSEALQKISTVKENSIKNIGPEMECNPNHLISFHKLSQWLTYSLSEPLAYIGITVTGMEKMTGLAEYRNGGLFVDMGVIKLKEKHPEMINSKKEDRLPRFETSDDCVVEWRALTVALLDQVADKVRKALKISAEKLSLPKVLEAGTWKAGREVAAKKRPYSKGPPFELVTDGTLF